MKKLFVDQQNILTLDSQFTNKDGLDVELTLVGESGVALNDGVGDPISAVAVAWDASLNKYKTAFTLEAGTTPQYVRAFWYVEESGKVIDTPGFSPEDIQLVSSSVSISPEILPLSLFITSYLASDSKLDETYKRAVAAWIGVNGDVAREEIMGAQGNLEEEIKMFFFRRTDSVQRDFYMQDFRSEFWQLQMDYSPIISVDTYELKYGNSAQEITANIAEHIQVSKEMGILEFLPTTMNGNLWSALISSVTALGITMMNDSGYSRIPLLFRVTYTHGLDFPNLPPSEKSSIRNAVGRRAMINLLPRIDPIMRRPSESKSVDGASKSRSGGMKEILKDYREDEKVWVHNMRNRYARNMDMTIV